MKQELILKAYDLLSDVTPKKYDCGTLCSAACCGENASHGGEGEYGMLLLPGEKELLYGETGFHFAESGDGDMLVCRGECLRDIRPFACRIFPFYPHIERHGERYSVKIKLDPRAAHICPICADFRKRKANIRFYRYAKRAVRVLMQDVDILCELCAQSDIISDIENLKKLILSPKQNKCHKA